MFEMDYNENGWHNAAIRPVEDLQFIQSMFIHYGGMNIGD
jgi:hypothetical protein